MDDKELFTSQNGLDARDGLKLVTITYSRNNNDQSLLTLEFFDWTDFNFTYAQPIQQQPNFLNLKEWSKKEQFRTDGWLV